MIVSNIPKFSDMANPFFTITFLFNKFYMLMQKK